MERLELNSKRVICESKQAIVPLDRYKSALVFGTINTKAAVFCMVTRLSNDDISVHSILNGINHGITGLYNSNTGLVELTLSTNNSFIILY